MEKTTRTRQQSNFEKNLINLADWTVMLGTLIIIWSKLKDKRKQT